jgi:hypothetical protein
MAQATFEAFSGGEATEHNLTRHVAEALRERGYLVVDAKDRAVLVVDADGGKLMIGVQRCE